MAQRESIIPVAKFDDIAAAAIDHFTSGRQKKRAIYVTGAPGGGKTDLAFHVGAKCGFKKHEIMLLKPGNYTPLDLVGVPTVIDGVTQFNPLDKIHQLATGQYKLVVLDETPDAVPSVQNILRSMVYEFNVGGVDIHPDTNFFMTGNEVKHKSGANRTITKLENAVYRYTLGNSVDGWVNHAISQGWNSLVVAWVAWRGEQALYGEEGFDPESPINNSPRQMEEVCHVNENLPANIYLNQLSALIPVNWAQDFMSFKATVSDLPPISVIFSNPDTAPVSDKIDVNYALTSRLMTEVKDVFAFQKLFVYMARLPVEMQTLYVSYCTKRIPEAKETPEYSKHCLDHQALYGAGQ